MENMTYDKFNSIVHDEVKEYVYNLILYLSNNDKYTILGKKVIDEYDNILIKALFAYYYFKVDYRTLLLNYGFKIDKIYDLNIKKGFIGQSSIDETFEKYIKQSNISMEDLEYLTPEDVLLRIRTRITTSNPLYHLLFFKDSSYFFNAIKNVTNFKHLEFKNAKEKNKRLIKTLKKDNIKVD